MIIDTSALVAIMREEEGADRYDSLINDAPFVSMSAASYVEAVMVMVSGRNGRFRNRLDQVIGEFSIEIVPVTAEQAHLAADAFIAFGKGRHSAALNYGDCFAYALAKATGEPLLFKGNDFTRTDVAPAT